MKYIQTYSPGSIAIARNDTWPYKTMADIKAGRGVNVIFTGAMYNMSAVRPVQTFKQNGELLSYEGCDYYGYGWNGNGGDITFTDQHRGYEHFISGLPALIREGKAIAPLSYPPEIRGRRGRVALGFTEGGDAIIHASTDADGACTVEELQKRMLDAGCRSAINLDGGGSVQISGPLGNIEPTRTVYNFICIQARVFRLQFGAFISKANAIAYQEKLKQEGYNTIIKED